MKFFIFTTTAIFSFAVAAAAGTNTAENKLRGGSSQQRRAIDETKEQLDGWYEVKPNDNQSYCLDVLNGSTDNFTPLQIWPCNGSDAQKFSVNTDGRVFSKLGAGTSCVEMDPAYGGLSLLPLRGYLDI